MRLFALLLFVSTLTAASPARAQEADYGDAVANMQAVLATQQHRFDAMTRGDLAALDTLLASNLVYTHSNGQADTKASLLASLRSGALAYAAIEPTDINIQLFADAAVITGLADVRVVAGGEERALTLRFTEVYVQWDAGEPWQLVSWQSTRVP